jgi:hypothetical protein
VRRTRFYIGIGGLSPFEFRSNEVTLHYERVNLGAGQQPGRRLVPCGKRQQGDVPGLLDGAGQATLVRGTNAGEPPRDDLAAFRYKPLQEPDIAVRDGVDLLGAEFTDLFAAEKLAAAAGSTGGPSAGWASAAGAGGGAAGTRT